MRRFMHVLREILTELKVLNQNVWVLIKEKLEDRNMS